MAGTNSGTENVAFDSVSAHGKPVTLKEELPGYSGVGSAPPTDEFDDPPLVKRTERVETTRVSKPVGNGDEGDSELKQKLLVAGALVAAGVAIVFGVRHFRGEEQPEETKNWAQRKAKEAKHEAKHAAKETKEAGGDAGDWVNEKSGGLLDSASDAAHKVGSKAHDAAHKVGSKAHDAYDTVADKVDDLRHEAKDKVEADTKHADKRAASPAADLEQRRMTYGQDKHGVPKGLTEDAGFLGYKNWLPFARTK